jgi:hypothetical protein
MTTPTKGVPMFLSLILSRLNRFNRSSRFTWSPSLNLEDGAIRSALLPGTQY